MKTSIIILNYNTLDCLKKCVESIKKFTLDYELIIIDNGSSEEGTKPYILEVSDNSLFNKENKGFAKGCNQGAKLATGQLLCFLNSDTIVRKGWLNEMKMTLSNKPKCAAVGPLGNTRYRKIWNHIWRFQQYIGQYVEDTRVNFLSGYCLLIKRDIFKDYYWDEEFELGLFEDNYLCQRLIQDGYELWVCASAEVIHKHPSESFRRNNIDYLQLMEKNKLIFEKKMEVLWKDKNF